MTLHDQTRTETERTLAVVERIRPVEPADTLRQQTITRWRNAARSKQPSVTWSVARPRVAFAIAFVLIIVNGVTLLFVQGTGMSGSVPSQSLSAADVVSDYGLRSESLAPILEVDHEQ